MNLLKFLCNFPIDKFGKVCYNGNFDTWRTSTRRQIKKSEYFNSLHCATGFTQHSVGIHCAPLPMTFWRISLACGFYLGGLLIFFTSFSLLCIYYTILYFFCSVFLLKFFFFYKKTIFEKFIKMRDVPTTNFI